MVAAKERELCGGTRWGVEAVWSWWWTGALVVVVDAATHPLHVGEGITGLVHRLLCLSSSHEGLHVVGLILQRRGTILRNETVLPSLHRRRGSIAGVRGARAAVPFASHEDTQPLGDAIFSAPGGSRRCAASH